MRRAALLGAAWTASAAAAVGLGFLAVSLVDASAAPQAPRPVATSAPTSSTPTTGPNPSGQQATVGGTVFATCTSGVPDLAGAPAAGWWVDDSSEPGEVEFTDGGQKVEVHAVCTGGAPQFSVEGPRAESGGGSSVPAPATESTSGGGDSGGGGGHGSDDSGGDD